MAVKHGVRGRETDMGCPVIKALEVSYHRNGISGEGFHVVRFSFTEDGVAHPNMVATVFDGPGYVAVLDADMLAVGNIAFAKGNSWRGDHFEKGLRVAIEEYRKQQDREWKKELAAMGKGKKG
jgi:hypothetical protein